MAKEFNYSASITEHKKFKKYTAKSFGKVYLVVRTYNDNSGVDYHFKFCPDCGAKFNIERVKIKHGPKLVAVCSECSKRTSTLF